MKPILRRVGRLEDCQAISSGKPKPGVRLIVSLPWKGPANLATSTCLRYLRAGCITEVVELDGDEAAIREEELEKFIASFPVQASARAESKRNQH